MPLTIPSSSFQTVIFDLGGVILNLSYQKTIDAFSTLCGFDAAKLYTQQQQNPIFDNFETGAVSAEQFRNGLREVLQISASDHDLDAAWNAMLGDIPAQRIDFLKELGAKKQLFLLSNTNAIHKQAFDKALFEAHGLTELDSLFQKAYYSHLMGDRKPNPGIFQRIVDENGLDAKKTLFIDDSSQHIEGARLAGLHAYHLQAPETILELGL